jgi:mannose-6-phosphate isomerase-like protein (cupin superfamily)
MFVRDLNKCKAFIAGDQALLRELFNPAKDEIEVTYSLGHATVKPHQTTLNHKLTTSEVYYILQGQATMHLDKEIKQVRAGQAIYIPPGSEQKITNPGNEDLLFLCIVEPAWRPEDEQILEPRSDPDNG